MQGERRRMTRRLLFNRAVSGAGALALAACGGAATSPESDEAPREETGAVASPKALKPTTVSGLMVQRGQSDTWTNSWNTIFAKFEANHPAYRLEIIDTRFELVTSRALTTMAAGFTFDFIYGYFGWQGLFVDAGIIQSIDPFLANDTEVSPDDFFEYGILKHKGTAYGLAWLLTTHPIWFNNSKFVEADLKTPAELEDAGIWTWEAVLNAAVRLTKWEGDSITFGGLEVFPMFTSNLPYYAWAWGTDLWDEGCTEATFNIPEFLEAVQYCVDLFAGHKVIGGNFLRGTQGMFEGATGGVRQFEERITRRNLFEIGMAPRPKGPSGDRATVMTPTGIFIGHGAKNEEGAWAFIRHTVSDTALPEIAATGHGRFTASKHLQPLTQYPFENAQYYKQMASEGRPVPQLLLQGYFDTAWRTTWDAMVEGSLSVAAGMAKMQEHVQAWINVGGCLR